MTGCTTNHKEGSEDEEEDGEDSSVDSTDEVEIHKTSNGPDLMQYIKLDGTSS